MVIRTSAISTNTLGFLCSFEGIAQTQWTDKGWVTDMKASGLTDMKCDSRELPTLWCLGKRCIMSEALSFFIASYQMEKLQSRAFIRTKVSEMKGFLKIIRSEKWLKSEGLLWQALLLSSYPGLQRHFPIGTSHSPSVLQYIRGGSSSLEWLTQEPLTSTSDWESMGTVSGKEARFLTV